MKRLLSGLFVWFVLVAPLGVQDTHTALAASTQPTGAYSGSQQPSTEIEGWRTAHSRTYAADGHYSTQIFANDINFKDASGAWQPIDNTLVGSSTPGYAYENRQNRYVARFPSDIGAKPVHFALGSSWVDFSLTGATGAGAVSGATDTYSLPGGSVAFTAESDALKDALTLNSVSSPASYTYQLQTSPGLVVSQNSQGGIDFVASGGAVVFSFAPPYMYDQAGTISQSVSLHLSSGANGPTVTLSADPTWLASPARQWPVVIDPTVSLGGTADCNMISGTSANTSYCATSPAKIGWDGTSFYRYMLKFDLSSIPSNATILNSELDLRYYTGGSSSEAVGLYQLTRAWTSSATWNKYDGTNAWTTAGGDFNPTAVSTVSNVMATSGGWDRWFLTQLTQGWVNGTVANDGVLFKEPTENVNAVVQFYADKAFIDNPYLQVNYDYWLGQQSFYTMAGAAQLDDRMGLGVNVANGNLVVHASDLNMPGVGLPLAVDRYYNSLNTNSGAPMLTDVGNNWSLGTGRDTGLSIYNDGSAAFHAPSGFQIPFTRNADGSFTPPPAIDATLVKNGDSTYSLTFEPSGEMYNFTSGGYLTSDVDASGNKLSFSYITGTYSQLLSSITDTQGHTTSLSYVVNNGQQLVQKITDPAGRLYQYGYDANHNLTTYTDPANRQTKFAYDANYNLTQITDPNGNETKFTYDSSKRVASIVRVTNLTAGTGPTISFTYNSGSTVIADPNGNKTTFAYDASGRATSETDPMGDTTQTGWTADSHVSQVTDPSGHVTSNSYSTLHSIDRLLSRTSPLGAATSFSYGNSALPYKATQMTNAEGKTTTLAYNSDGTVASVSDPLQNNASYTYNTNGTVATSTPPDGNASQTPTAYQAHYSWNSGLLTKVTAPAPLGARSYSYNSYNQVASATDGKGQTTSYSYNAVGEVTGATYADSSTVGYATDADGNLTAMTDNTGTYTYSYDSLNELTQKTYPNGDAYSYTYDAAGNLTSEKGPCGGNSGKLPPCPQTNYGYNSLGEIATAQVIPNCGCTNPPPTQTTTYQYSPTGQVTQALLGDGLTEHYSYDADGNVTAITVTNPGGQIVLSQNYSYTDPTTGKQTNQVTSYTDTEGYTHTQTYDAAGHLIKDVASNPSLGVNNTYAYTYDQNGNLLSETINGGVVAQLNYNTADELTGKGTGTTCTSDANGNQTSCSDGTAETYGASNNPTSVTPPGAGAVSLGFSGNDPSQPSNIGGTQTESSLAQLAYQLFQNGSSQSYQSLPDGTLVTMTTSSGQLYYFLEDANGNITAMADANGNIVDQCTYDDLGKASCSGSVSSPFGFGGQLQLGGGLLLGPGGVYDPSSDMLTGGGTVFSKHIQLAAGTATAIDPNQPGEDSSFEGLYAQVVGENRVLLYLLITGEAEFTGGVVQYAWDVYNGGKLLATDYGAPTRVFGEPGGSSRAKISLITLDLQPGDQVYIRAKPVVSGADETHELFYPELWGMAEFNGTGLAYVDGGSFGGLP